jgi:shikimate kinase
MRKRHKAVSAVALIGMPSSGKSKIGKLFAEMLGCDFVDTDECIVRHFGAKNLQDVVNRMPANDFTALEGAMGILAASNLSQKTVIATGGSMIYSTPAMEYLRRNTHIVHLRASLKVIERRVARHPAERGIVFAPGETLADLYRRRMPLYKQWKHRTFDTSHHRSAHAARLAKQIAEEVFY